MTTKTAKPKVAFEIEWEDLETGLHYAIKGEGTRRTLIKLQALLASHPQVMQAWTYKRNAA